MEPSNKNCPRCGKGGYIYALYGSNVGELNMKCTNCGAYYKASEIYHIEDKPKQTHFEQIRDMSIDELAELLNRVQGDGYLVGIGCRKISAYPSENMTWFEWLQQEAE